jgi:hypothetical protein
MSVFFCQCTINLPTSHIKVDISTAGDMPCGLFIYPDSREGLLFESNVKYSVYLGCRWAFVRKSLPQHREIVLSKLGHSAVRNVLGECNKLFQSKNHITCMTNKVKYSVYLGCRWAFVRKSLPRHREIALSKLGHSAVRNVLGECNKHVVIYHEVTQTTNSKIFTVKYKQN